MPHLKQYKQSIREVLTEREDCRDNDRRLYFHVCLKLGIDLREITASRMLELCASRAIPNYDSMARERRAIQVEQPELEGKFTEERRTDGVLEAQHQLGYNTLDQRMQEGLGV